VSSKQITIAGDLETVRSSASLRWGALSLAAIVIATAFGNILLCLAVVTERRLQNMTNYFLASLAVADLLVAVVVMPLAVLIEVYGQPFVLIIIIIIIIIYSIFTVSVLTRWTIGSGS